jgi:hypothetical protein
LYRPLWVRGGRCADWRDCVVLWSWRSRRGSLPPRLGPLLLLASISG